MESTSPSQAKRMRLIDSLHVTECIREFKLPQQFPSMVTSTRSPGVLASKTKGAIAPSTNSIFSKAIRLVPSRESQCMTKLQRLRIKSQDGRDLGEINVQFLPQKGNVFRAKTITLTKPNVLSNLEKPVVAPLHVHSGKMEKLQSAVPNLTDDLENSKEVKVSKELISSDHASNIVCNNNKKWSSGNNVFLQKPLSLIGNNAVMHQGNIVDKLSANNLRRTNVSPKKALLLNVKAQEQRSVVSLKNNVQKDEALAKAKNLVLARTESGNLMVHNHTTSNTEPLVKKHVSFYCDRSNLDNVRLQSNAEERKLTLYEQTVIPKHSLAKYKDLMIYKKKNINKKLVKNAKAEIASQCETRHDTRVSVPQICNKEENKAVSQSNTQIHNVMDKELLENQGVIKNGSEIINTFGSEIDPQKKNLECTGNRPQSRTKLGKNVMVIVHNRRPIVTDRNLLSSTGTSKNINRKGKDASNVECPILNSMTNENEPANSLKISESNIPRSHLVSNGIAGSNADKTRACLTSEDTSFQKRLSDQLGIIKEAIGSVKDEELRTKALEALADCRIGIERYVPVRPPEELKTVHDTQMQTAVFGLLDKNNFILVKEDLPGLHRIEQNEHTAYKPVTLKSPQRELTDADNALLKSCTLPLIDEPCDLDSFFQDLCDQSTKANEVKEVLSKSNKLYERIKRQLQNDLETAKLWDENGLLNIHKAVMNNDIVNVQRFSIILHGCKESIDVRTESGATSLELAIKCNASESIVKLLLKAGAQPVLKEVAHDSALHIASKISSPFLLELINNIKDPKLLNQIDSAGFAALHYCALSGNFEGINALLQAGADVNLKDNRSGRTPIFHALENKHSGIAQRLFQRGAIPNIQNFAGQSVLSILEDVKNLSLRTSLNKLIK